MKEHVHADAWHVAPGVLEKGPQTVVYLPSSGLVSDPRGKIVRVKSVISQ